jgi:hypothetical protein
VRIVFHGDLEECQDAADLIALLADTLRGESRKALASVEVVVEDEAAA